MPQVLAGHCCPVAAVRQHPAQGARRTAVPAAVTRCCSLSRNSIPCRCSTPCRLNPHGSHQTWTGTLQSSSRRQSLCVARGILDTYRQDQAAATKEAGEDEPPCTVECVKDIYCGKSPCLVSLHLGKHLQWRYSTRTQA